MTPALTAIFKREFFGYFRTPVAYVFLMVFVLSSIGLTWFLGRIFENNEASMAVFFLFCPWVFLFLVPAVGMRLWAEERRSGTWELLFTLPVRVEEAVIGKFLAAWAFIGIALACTLTLPLTLAYLGSPDWGIIAAGYAGSFLLAGAYLGICSLASAFTRSQVIAFVLSLCACLTLVLSGWSVFNGLLRSLSIPVWITDILNQLSFLPHHEPMTMGLIRIQDLGYFLSFIATTIALNILILKR
jgi:ABC-2 type transport system permease protein